jgi:NADPH:quinone reductase-like Zn-dependent oxidoreductase
VDGGRRAAVARDAAVIREAEHVRAVRFTEYGDVDVLQVVDVEEPLPADGEVLVRVLTAGTNPGEGSIRRGELHDRWPATFPSGQGSDFAGVVEVAGVGVTRWRTGDEVIGYTDARASHAEYVVVPAENLVAKPPALEWELAGGLPVAGSTAWAAVEAVRPVEGETVVIAAAGGGVGVWASQLCLRLGARVIGTGSADGFDFLRSIGVRPVEYGDGLEQRIRELAPRGVDAFIDLHGDGNVALALALGVPADRIDTVVDFDAAARWGVRTDGSAAGRSPEVIEHLAQLLADRQLVVPLSAVYTLDEVQDAYRELEEGHTRGKIVLGLKPIDHKSNTHKGVSSPS